MAHYISDSHMQRSIFTTSFQILKCSAGYLQLHFRFSNEVAAAYHYISDSQMQFVVLPTTFQILKCSCTWPHREFHILIYIFGCCWHCNSGMILTLLVYFRYNSDSDDVHIQFQSPYKFIVTCIMYYGCVTRNNMATLMLILLDLLTCWALDCLSY